jgi:serine/threonine protein kinase/formylglycine-generating enzyme required for sulfatase activity
MKECPECRRCYDDAVKFCAADGKTLIASVACSKLLNGRYILERRLGKGGMGIVFKAKHKFLKSLHAVKIISPDLVQEDESLLIRFRQEAVLAASIHHPNVVTVTDFGVENDTMPFLVMEYVEGVSLTDYLIKEKILPPVKAFEILSSIGAGVEEAHSRGIVHRDLKSHNIMLKANLPLKNAVKVLDFGLAKIKSGELFGSLIQAQTVNLAGSPLYMAPEQWFNENIDHHADIYALGIILFQMLTGSFPFRGDSIPAIMYKHLNQPPPSFESLGVKLPPQIEAVARKALEKDASLRQNSIKEFIDEFEAAIFSARASTSPAIKQDTKQAPLVETQQIADTTAGKVSGYLDLKPELQSLADRKLAQEFLQAQQEAEEAKQRADKAEHLAREFAEAQKRAEEAKRAAFEAQEKAEAEVRRRVQAEMEDKLTAEQQARQKAEAEAARLAEEAEARRKAEELANELAQKALEAQQRAEAEQKKAEKEARRREVETEVRRKAEADAKQLAQQIAEEKRKYEEAREKAEKEANLRLEAEAKRQRIELQIKSIEEAEAERRREAEARARQEIEEQASRFEREAAEAEQKIEEAKRLAEQEAQKREQAEAAQRLAEENARRLAEEIRAQQMRIEEMQKAIHQSEAATHQGDQSSSFERISGGSFQVSNSAVISQEASHSGFNAVNTADTNLNTQPELFQNQSLVSQSIQGLAKQKKFVFPLAAVAVIAFLFIGFGGFAVYLLLSNGNQSLVSSNSSLQPPQPGQNNNSETPGLSNRLKTKMVPIRGGDFQIGSSDVKPDLSRYGLQYPAHQESVGSFYIDRTEVTNQDYAEFVNEAKYPPPASWTNGKPPIGKEKYPVTEVSLIDAKKYAEWVSKREQLPCRLPTEEEWEYAARNGAQQTLFPWGNDPRPSAANVATKELKEVGSSADETAVGSIKDLLGNVIEWTSSPFVLYTGHPNSSKTRIPERNYTVRGTSFGEEKDELENLRLMTGIRQPVSENEKSPYIGFRLVCLP